MYLVILDCFTDDAIADLGAVVLAGMEQLRPLIRDRYAKYSTSSDVR